MSFFDISDAEGVELEERWDDVTSVEECVHGEHPLECSLCTSAGLHAAVSGEGEDDMTMTAAEEHADAQVELMIDKFADEATVAQLKRAIYRIEHEVAKRKAENDRERKELEQFEKPVRKTRSDAGTKRARKEAAA